MINELIPKLDMCTKLINELQFNAEALQVLYKLDSTFVSLCSLAKDIPLCHYEHTLLHIVAKLMGWGIAYTHKGFQQESAICWKMSEQLYADPLCKYISVIH